MPVSEIPKKKYAALLKERALKATPVLLALLRVLAETHEPMSIPELVAHLPKERKADTVTVYRAIEAFIETGLVRQIHLRHGHMDYEFALHPDHHHLVCTHCGRMEEFADCDMDALVKTVLKQHPSFASIQEHALELFGVCMACSKTN